MRFFNGQLKALALAGSAVIGLAGASAALAQDAGSAAASDPSSVDPNYRTPAIFVVEQEGAEAHFVIGEGAWGDVIATLGVLRESPRENDAAIIQQLWGARDENPPVFLFEVARRAVESQPELALEAYLLGRIRAIYDAQRCVDSSALGVVNASTQYAGEDVLDLMAERLASVPGLLESFIATDSAFTGQASPWWACSFSDSVYFAAVNEAPLTGPEWLKVEANWPSIRADVAENVQANATLVRAAVENAAAE